MGLCTAHFLRNISGRKAVPRLSTILGQLVKGTKCILHIQQIVGIQNGICPAPQALTAQISVDRLSVLQALGSEDQLG